MDSNNNTETTDDFFDFDLPKDQVANSRIATRYVRNDIKASLSKNGLFNFGREIPADLIDISTRGALIRIEKKLSVRDKITLELKFDCGKSFKIAATVVRKAILSDNQYGIKFDQYNDELGDCLLETQKELIFK